MGIASLRWQLQNRLRFLGYNPRGLKKKQRERRLSFLLPALLLIVFFAVRLPALGRFVTTDEALWLRRSANFYLAISNGEWDKTFQSPHPGVVTLWAGAAGFWFVFPEYSHVGSEFIYDSQLLTLMENRSINPIEILAAGRLVLVLTHAAAFLAAWPFARRLLGMPAAALGMALLALDPFTIAHQRLLHLDGLLASFMLLTVLAYLGYLRAGRWPSLLISGIAAGLAWLTKTPAWFLLPAMLALTVYFWWRGRSAKSPIPNYQFPLWLSFFIWLASALLVAFLFFPALWSDPIGIPAQMASYALGSAEGEYSGPVFFNGVVYPEGDLDAVGWIFYPLVFLWRSTPLTLIGLCLSLWNVAAMPYAQKRDEPEQQTENLFVLLLLAFSLGFILFMTIAGKKFDRYLLPALPPLILVAGWGWVLLTARVKWFQQEQWRATALLIGVGTLQLASALPAFPYYLSYYDPLMGGRDGAPEVMMVGWGEGLDQAADYLNRQPGLQAGEAAVWYSVSFNLMAGAEVADIPIKLELNQSELSDLLAKKYLVIYIHQWQRGTPQNLLDALEGLEPEFRVWINGLEYVRIYHLEEEALVTGPHEDGVYLVDVTISSGLWRSIPQQEGGYCYWARRKYDGILLDSHYAPGGSEVLIRPTDYEVEFDGCGTWVYMGER